LFCFVLFCFVLLLVSVWWGNVVCYGTHRSKSLSVHPWQQCVLGEPLPLYHNVFHNRRFHNRRFPQIMHIKYIVLLYKRNMYVSLYLNELSN
jgi:hypothetical protein